MSDLSNLNTALAEKYKNNFFKEEHTPQKIFNMNRAKKREEVLTYDSMWMCTSCYNCIVRCPRELPITHIMHGLVTYAKRLGLAPKEQPTTKFAALF
jgi:quinone-modifying oxidoreductase, subunit QmoC